MSRSFQLALASPPRRRSAEQLFVHALRQVVAGEEKLVAIEIDRVTPNRDQDEHADDDFDDVLFQSVAILKSPKEVKREFETEE